MPDPFWKWFGPLLAALCVLDLFTDEREPGMACALAVCWLAYSWIAVAAWCASGSARDGVK